ncbi:GNAT family N-acetyltransferase [Luteipulveratus halotolerans]|uniref:N-acetyltransferase domain-containing protein n=1 Tax=Luteipulveratus halotolerans TaxID=1631356 RepID=A0A0L6CDU6_9MICO|nr:GNAT family N-acetyltransferase [Luteipulveratus halotolerans]KNX36041.1 hypothetical protein VV01_00925 [Luteipulveratus halotolerans]
MSNAHAVIRLRRDSDLPELAQILVAVHALDGYPVEGVDNPLAWLVSDSTLSAWVAELDGKLVGHVALSDPSESEGAAKLWAEQHGNTGPGLAMLGRLFVSPAGRGRGLGARLTATATNEARRMNRRAVLDVMEKDVAARKTYERLGWIRLGEFDHAAGAGRAVPAIAYAAPTE